MKNKEKAHKYELIVIADSKMATDEKEGILKNALDAVNKAGGKVINSQVWLDKHKLAFSIKKRTEGTYYLVNFEGSGLTANQTRDTLRLNEKILRFAVLNVD